MPCSSWLTDGEQSQSSFMYLIQCCYRIGAKEKCIFLNCVTQALGTNHSCLDPCLGHLPYTYQLISYHALSDSLPSNGTFSMQMTHLCKDFFLITCSTLNSALHEKKLFDFIVNQSVVIFFFFLQCAYKVLLILNVVAPASKAKCLKTIMSPAKVWKDLYN